jgi:PRTRC genetic system protein B
VKIIVHEDSPDRYTLASAILLYQTKDRNAALAVEHDIHATGKSLGLGAGRFVTGDFVAKLLEMLDSTPLAYIPPHVVAINRDAVAWWTPAATRRMYFRATPDVAVNAFDGVELAQPPLVFVARRRMLRVFALMANERPMLETTLAQAPYFNVSDAGNVCLGSMHLPKAMNPDDTDQWTRAFFASEFTHFNGTSKRWAHTGTYAELLADLSREGTFQSQWLKSTSLTLSNAIGSR